MKPHVTNPLDKIHLQHTVCASVCRLGIAVLLGGLTADGLGGEKQVPESPEHTFRSPEEAGRWLKQRELETQSNILQQMEKIGATPSDLRSLKERFALENADNSVRTWEDWTNRYRPVILNPPAPFDAYEPWAIDFKSPAAATRSYWHALFVGKAEALITHADESGRAWLQTQLKVDVQHPKSSYALFTNLSRITILLTATNQFGGKDYAVVLSRVEALLHPLTNRVAFSMDLFRREGGLYLISNDLSLLSPFRAVTVAARANGANLLPYPQFYEQVKHSAFPPHFYTIKE